MRGAALVLALPMLLAGCRSGRTGFSLPSQGKWQATLSDARQDLGSIPPSKKTLLTKYDSESKWRNPFLTVSSTSIQLSIYLADQNNSDFDRGGMTRLRAARKQVVTVRLRDLPRALTSLPDSAWPDGRAVGINEALEPPSQKGVLDRNMQTTSQALQTMAVTVIELDH
jgi:hypothetical protein